MKFDEKVIENQELIIRIEEMGGDPRLNAERNKVYDSLEEELNDKKE